MPKKATNSQRKNIENGGSGRFIPIDKAKRRQQTTVVESHSKRSKAQNIPRDARTGRFLRTNEEDGQTKKTSIIVHREVYNTTLAELLQTIKEEELVQALEAHLKIRESNRRKPVIKKEEKGGTETNTGDAGWEDFLENIDEYAVETGISDLAENHDHYLYGTPKRT